MPPARLRPRARIADAPRPMLEPWKYWFVVGLALCATACGGDEHRSGDGRVAVSHLTDLTPDRQWETGDEREVASLEIPPDGAGWELDNGRVVEHPKLEEPMVVLEKRGLKTLRIPLPADLEEFNVLRVQMRVRGRSALRVDLFCADGSKCNTEYQLLNRYIEEQEIEVGIPQARVLTSEPDHMLLTVGGGALRVSFRDLRLSFRPWENWAAAMDDDRKIVNEVTRPVRVVATDNPRRGTVAIPADGVLAFHASRVPGLSFERPQVTLHIRVTAGEESVERAVSLSSRRARAHRWEYQKVDVGSLAGREARVEFSLTSDSDAREYALMTPPTAYTPSDAPRTVLLVTSDTHRADHVAITADSVGIATPALDALGERGLVFDDCYSSTNLTLPSHAALLTATSPRDTRVLDNLSGLGEQARTLAEGFHERGYATLASASVAHLQDEWSGLGQGFDGMACPKLDAWDGERTIRHLQSMLSELPDRDVFLWLHLFDAHRPYEGSEEHLDQYWPEGRDPFEEEGKSFPPVVLGPEMRGLRDGAYMDANYKAEVSYVDELLAAVLEIPRIAEGWIAVTADHGESLGEYDVWWHHEGVYPMNLHVPMILAGPGVPAGRRVSGPVEHLDLGRTLLDLSGNEDVEFPGENMLRHAEREPAPDTPRFGISHEAVSAYVQIGGWHCILQLGEWALVGSESRKEPHSMELYDLRPGGDPVRNVAAENVERTRRMRALILDWLAKQRPIEWLDSNEEISPNRIAQVRALGYAGTTTDPSAMWVDPSCDCEHCELYRER